MDRNRLSQIDVLILCGGLGQRLRSEIGETQKTMAVIEERPFLDILLHHLEEQGFKRVILCTGFEAGQVEDYYCDHRFFLKIEFSRESEPLGTGGALKHARALIQSDSFFVLNGDSFCACDYLPMLDFHYSLHSLATIAVAQVVERKDFGSIVLDEKYHIVRFDEKIEIESPTEKFASQYVNAGIYCFEKRLLRLMPDADQFSLEKELFPLLSKQNHEEFFGYVVKNRFIDIGTPQRFKAAEEYFRKGD